MEEEISSGKFRADLYYYINVVRLRLPRLRERCEDTHLSASAPRPYRLTMPLSLPTGQSSTFQVWFDPNTIANASGSLTLQACNRVFFGAGNTYQLRKQQRHSKLA